MVKVCLQVPAAAMVLLLMVATAQGIRLDAGSKVALGNPVLNVSGCDCRLRCFDVLLRDDPGFCLFGTVLQLM